MSAAITIVSLVISAIGVLVAIVIYLRSRKEKRPIWYFRTRKVIGLGENESSDIQILFKGHVVPQVSVTKLGFANLGRETILNSEVREQIRTTFYDDVEILGEPKIIRCSRPAIDLSATREGEVVNISFAFLDHKDGGVVEIAHTGDVNTIIQLDGTIIGVKKGIKQQSDKYALTRTRKESMVGLVIGTVWTIFLLGLFILVTIKDVSDGGLDVGTTIIFVGFIIPLIYLLIVGIRNVTRSLPMWLSLDD